VRSAASAGGVSQRLVDAYRQHGGTSALPAYSRIEWSIQQLIADGTMQPGHRLPTVGELAQALGIATNTAAHAYAQLIAQGAITARAGAGTIVAERSIVANEDAASNDVLRRSARRLVAYSLFLGYAPAEVLHAVLAELAALGRGGSDSTDQPHRVRPSLPVHTVPIQAVGPEESTLLIDGLVRQPYQLSESHFRRLPRMQLEQPFACDEGWVVPVVRWAGVPLDDVLALTTLREGDRVVVLPRTTVDTRRLALIHIRRCRRSTLCRSRWSSYH